MDIKKKALIFFLVLLVPASFYAQLCGTLKINTVEAGRKYYLLDSVYDITDFEQLKKKINPEDTALVRIIVEKGNKSYNHTELFVNSGIDIKKVTFVEFYALPRDSVVLNRKEKRLKKRYEKLQRKDILSKNDGETGFFTDKLTRKSKFLKLVKKMHGYNSYMFGMYPVYTYKNHTLFIYSIYPKNKIGHIAFCYDICEAVSDGGALSNQR